MDHSLHDLHQFLRRALALNLPDPLWITAELAQVSLARGHLFLELVQKDEGSDGILAQAPAVVWDNVYRRLRRLRGKTLEHVFRQGLEVRLQVRVDFHERYGYKLLVEDADPAFTLGRLELRRRAALDQLRQEGALERNRALALSPVVQRLAVISSETAAGYEDFRRQLQENAYGFGFATELFIAAMQGDVAPAEIRRQLKTIGRRASHYDAIVIIRGGGARLDLTAFDDLELCRTAAGCPLPILTGIGHEVDETLLDLVAHTRLKTPTAAADFLIAHSLHFEAALLQLGRRLHRLASDQLQDHERRLDYLSRQAQLLSHARLQREQQQLQFLQQQLPQLARARLRQASRELDHYDRLLQALDPQTALNRGFSLVVQQGRIIRQPEEIDEKEPLTLRLKSGNIQVRKG